MKTKKNIILLFCIVLSFTTNAQNQPQNGIESDKKGIAIGDLVKMSGNWFIAYRNGLRQVQADETHTASNEKVDGFVLKRSYFTLKKDLSEHFAVRYTMDLTIDKEGSDEGNVETRLKYLYIKAKPNLGKNFTGTWVEAGMVHRPWLDYEQKINTYRVQDNMFIERNRIFNSADLGITIGGNIGPKMDKQFLKQVNGAMKGKYCSYSLGLYNGGGYSGLENNDSKVFAARVSFRPFANKFPELQVSGYFNTGKGNSPEEPNFNQVLAFLAYTGKNLTLTAQHHQGEGDFRAKYVIEDNPSKALKNSGYSFFGEYKIKNTPLALWARFDNFDLNEVIQKSFTKRYIGGVTYRVNKNLRIVANAEHSDQNMEKNDIYEVNLEISF